MVIRVSHLTDQVEIGGGVHAPILPVERGPAPPPSAGPRSQNPNANPTPTPSPALDSYTSIPLGGYDDPFLFQILKRLRYKMNDENIAAAVPIPSFLIECLCWNVPINTFILPTYAAVIRETIVY